MQPVYLICGVSGAGKTWLCRKLQHKFTYVPHDEHYHYQTPVVLEAAKGDKPVITECPFAERILKNEMEMAGLKVTPFFVVTPPDVVAAQYFAREGKVLPKGAYTRATTIMNRALEWQAFHGSSQEVFEHLSSL